MCTIPIHFPSPVKDAQKDDGPASDCIACWEKSLENILLYLPGSREECVWTLSECIYSASTKRALYYMGTRLQLQPLQGSLCYIRIEFSAISYIVYIYNESCTEALLVGRMRVCIRAG